MAEDRPEYTLITGASSGIGRALAARLSAGRRLVLHGRNAARLEETLAGCADPGSHIQWNFDFRDVPGLSQSLAALLATNKIVIDCLIHSAAMLSVLPVRNITYQVAAEVMNVNFISALEIVGLLVKKRVNSGRLRNILFLSSIASKFGAPGFGVYSASKGALDAAMRALAVELAPAVRVNSILPGGLSTPMTAGLLAEPGVGARLERDYPLGLGQVEDIVNAAAFLISDQARWITGQQIVLDGGRTANISI